MLYKEITIGNKDYKAVLNASASIMAEEKLGENALNVMAKIADTNELPELKKVLIILHASLQKYQHGISLQDTYDIYDQFIEDGHQFGDLLPLLLDIFEVSGYFKREPEGKKKKEAKEKN